MQAIMSSYSIPNLRKVYTKEDIKYMSAEIASDIVLKELSRIYNVTVENIKGHKREVVQVYIRAIYCFFMRSHFNTGRNYKTGNVGRRFLGKQINKSHKSILYYVNTFKRDLKDERVFIATKFASLQLRKLDGVEINNNYLNTSQKLETCLLEYMERSELERIH